MKILVRLWAAFMEEPVMMKQGDIFRHCPVEKLKISAELKSEIQNWDDEYQNTFDHNDPLGSNFTSDEIAMAHKKRGAQIAEQLQMELGDQYIVEYKV